MSNKYIDELIDIRGISRQNKDWGQSDEIRNYLDSKNVFIFDTKNGQEAYHCPESYFKKKPEPISKRQYVEYIIKRDINAEKRFDAWLFSITNN